MATVNDQITDAVTQSNVKVLGEAPAEVLGNLYQTAAHSTGIQLENAVEQQQGTESQATTAAAGATEKIAQAGVADNPPAR